ncbi:queuosine transporter QueT [Ligilactobacillus salitolerans]|uniref:Queuosine transporter QueT n=1 Tax=Ligilactobacillus salitolerans TaxID=1808352 RepID=A0A401ITQ4_9LACO|nr:QueT transporter family protein [Ligilactobacillus salitolerans]GBG94896.1 queuosine transporter QueT [Ligilactobacillus salitolerans]
MTQRNNKIADLTKIALVAALYVVLTVVLLPFSYGPLQFRLSEMLNTLAVFNKRYIWGVTLGCLIANLWSSMGAVDMIFGTLQTLAMTWLSWYVGQHLRSLPAKLGATVMICTLMSWAVALELHLVSQVPFWLTYLTVGIGEFVVVVIGAVLIWLIARTVDLSK